MVKYISGEPGAVTENVRRAGAFAAVGSLSLLVPILAGRVADPLASAGGILPFVLVAIVSLYVINEGRLFDLLARPGDYEEGRLYGLAGFALAAAGLALLTTQFGLPAEAFVAGVGILVVGNLLQALARAGGANPFLAIGSFAAGGTVGGVGGLLAVDILLGTSLELPLWVFLAAGGALFAALLRSMLFESDDPLVMISGTLFLWGLLELGIVVGPTRVAIGLFVTILLGYIAYALKTASLEGMLTGVLLALLAITIGGYGWFALLITFFGLGGLASKFRYDTKAARGIAEDNEGARGSGNVLANSAVALVAVLAFAASEAVGLPSELFRFAFAGSVATAMADTFSSEIGGLYDEPRLVTTLRRVEPGTDGAVTWQGELVGIAAAGVIAGIAAVFFDLGPLATVTIVLAGVAGMTVDSLLGATLEGDRLDNQSVNFFATFGGAVIGAVLALAVGVV
jgi:uncharacterized protein (TIGR00297 family)